MDGSRYTIYVVTFRKGFPEGISFGRQRLAYAPFLLWLPKRYLWMCTGHQKRLGFVEAGYEDTMMFQRRVAVSCRGGEGELGNTRPTSHGPSSS
jgi:hypothetical protein